MNGAVLGDMTLGANGTYNLSGTISGNLVLAGTVNVVAPGSTTSGFNAVRLLGGAGSGVTAAAAKTVPTLYINGNLTTVPGSTLGITVAQGAAAPIQVAGTANITGTHLLVSIDDPNPERAATYLALTAQKGVTATASDASSASISLVPVLKTDGNNLTVTILNLAVPLSNSVTGSGRARRPKAVDRTKFGATGDYGKVVQELTALNGPQLQSALEQLSGEIHASTLRLTQLDAQGTTSLVQDQLSDFEHSTEDKDAADKAAGRKSGHSGAPWFQLAGSHTSFGGDGSSPGTANGRRQRRRLRLQGVAGADDGRRCVAEPGRHVADRSERLELDHRTARVRLFGIRLWTVSHPRRRQHRAYQDDDQSQISTSAATVPDVNGNPQPLSNGIDRDATSDQTADLSDAWTEVQHTKKWDSWTEDTKVGIRLTRLTRQPFSEVGADSISLVAPELQLHTQDANIDFHTWKRTGSYRPNIQISVHHTSGDTGNYADLHFAGAPDSGFSTTGAQIPLNTFSGLFGLTVRTFSGLEYTGRVRDPAERSGIDERVPLPHALPLERDVERRAPLRRDLIGYSSKRPFRRSA